MGQNTNTTDIKSQEKVFFPGINALRFFAALGVIITHIELIKAAFGFENNWNDPIIFNLGGLGVYFFFVLSGFLITFLLLKEKEKFGTIRIKEFYLRRILRIWPLYYLICILGFFVLPSFDGIQIPYLQSEFLEHYATNLTLYVLILPNLAFSMYSAVPHIGQLWSIGVEEQFYLVWPWIISKTKHILRFLSLLIFGIVIIKIGILLLGSNYGQSRWYHILKQFAAMSKFECMAIGGIGAYFLFHKNERILKLTFNPWVLNLSIICIPLLILLTPANLQDGVHIPFSFIFLIIILNVTSNKSIWLNLETKLFSYLGKISYGIYMYHLLIIPFVLFCYKYFKLELNPLSFDLFIYSSCILITILISGLSYSLFEHRFIRLKSKYAFIKSGGEKENTN